MKKLSKLVEQTIKEHAAKFEIIPMELDVLVKTALFELPKYVNELQAEILRKTAFYRSCSWKNPTFVKELNANKESLLSFLNPSNKLNPYFRKLCQIYSFLLDKKILRCNQVPIRAFRDFLTDLSIPQGFKEEKNHVQILSEINFDLLGNVKFSNAVAVVPNSLEDIQTYFWNLTEESKINIEVNCLEENKPEGNFYYNNRALKLETKGKKVVELKKKLGVLLGESWKKVKLILNERVLKDFEEIVLQETDFVNVVLKTRAKVKLL